MVDPKLVSGLWKTVVLSTGAVGLASWAGWWDWRHRKIPNWLTVPGLLVGLVLSVALWRWPGLKASLEGAGLCLGLLLPFVLVRGLGAGDWKLMGALGSFLGPQRVIVVLIGTVLIAGVMSVVEVFRQRKVQETGRNLLTLLLAYSTFNVNNVRAISLDNPGLLKIPFGVAAAFSTSTFFLIVFLVRFFGKLG
jgi:prepilin peptidase CpaA